MTTVTTMAPAMPATTVLASSFHVMEHIAPATAVFHAEAAQVDPCRTWWWERRGHIEVFFGGPARRVTRTRARSVGHSRLAEFAESEGRKVESWTRSTTRTRKVASVVVTLRGPSGNGQPFRDRLYEACFLVWPQRKAKSPQNEST